MAWFTANWFWVLVFIAFIAMHMFGHGGHGGHSGHSGHSGRGAGGPQQRGEDPDKDDTKDRAANPASGGHHH